MTEPIVERLRRRAASERTPGGQLVYVDPAMLLAAADEIERLRQRRYELLHEVAALRATSTPDEVDEVQP